MWHTERHTDIKAKVLNMGSLTLVKKKKQQHQNKELPHSSEAPSIQSLYELWDPQLHNATEKEHFRLAP